MVEFQSWPWRWRLREEWIVVVQNKRGGAMFGSNHAGSFIYGVSASAHTSLPRPTRRRLGESLPENGDGCSLYKQAGAVIKDARPDTNTSTTAGAANLAKLALAGASATCGRIRSTCSGYTIVGPRRAALERVTDASWPWCGMVIILWVSHLLIRILLGLGDFLDGRESSYSRRARRYFFFSLS
jgi:hypothetical protein